MHMSILNALPASMTLAPLNDVNNGRRRLVSIYPDAAHVDTYPPWPPQKYLPKLQSSARIHICGYPYSGACTEGKYSKLRALRIYLKSRISYIGSSVIVVL